MQLTTAPAPTTPAAEPTPVRRAPSILQVPAMPDGSAAAAASLDQVASYVAMLTGALGDDPSFYDRLVKRGFLDNAIDYTRYALEVLDNDRLEDNDGFVGMVEGAVLGSLREAQGLGSAAAARADLVAELRMAQSGASNAAKSLLALGTRPARS